MSIDGTQAHGKGLLRNDQAFSGSAFKICFVGPFQLDAFVLFEYRFAVCGS